MFGKTERMKVPIPINQKYALQMQNIKKRVCASRSALICLIITILTLMQYLYGTNMNFTQLTIYTKLENKTVWIDQCMSNYLTNFINLMFNTYKY